MKTGLPRYALRSLFWVFILALAACLPKQPSPIPASLQPITIALTPSVEPVSLALNSCSENFPEMALLIDEVPAPLLQSRPSDLMIWLGPPPDPSLFTTPLAWDQLVIITNTSNPLSSISTKNLTALFSGQITGWSDINGADKEVEIWIYPNGDEVRQIFETNIMVGSRFTSQAFLAPNPKAMLDAVAKDQGALGFIPDAWITPQVKILHVSPDLEEKLHQPVLAFTKDEPQALVRSFLLCLQGQTGQTTLSTKYQPLLQTSATP